jgi:hypothetical protein
MRILDNMYLPTESWHELNILILCSLITLGALGLLFISMMISNYTKRKKVVSQGNNGVLK